MKTATIHPACWDDVELVPRLRTEEPARLQRRQQIGGVQTDAEYRLGSAWRLSGGYLYNRAKVVEFDANPGLIHDTRTKQMWEEASNLTEAIKAIHLGLTGHQSPPKEPRRFP